MFFDDTPYTMGFAGETLTIMVDGTQLPIRFGAPGRELYIGRHPFRGAFGGPSIFATVNNVRHCVRIGGPPPEVKIEPEPAHELTHYLHNPHLAPPPSAFTAGSAMMGAPAPFQRSAGILPMPTMAGAAPFAAAYPLGAGLIMPNPQLNAMNPLGHHAVMQQPMQPMLPPPVAAVQQQPADLNSLITNLQMKGLLSAISSVAPPQKAREPTPPPIPSGLNMDEDVTREFNPPATLKQFSIRTLKM